MGLDLLLGAALGKGLDLLLKAGYDAARELLRLWSQRPEAKFKRAFDAAYQEALNAVPWQADFKELLQHKPFQQEVVAALLDPLNGFNPQLALRDWQTKLPQHAMALQKFFFALQNALIADPDWGPVLQRFHALHAEEARAQLRQQGLPETGRQFVEYVLKVEGDLLLDSVKVEAESIKAGMVNIAQQLVQNITINYLRQDPTLSEETLTRQIQQYLNWLEERFGAIVIKGIRRRGEDVVSLPLDQAYIPLEGVYQAETTPEGAPRRRKKPAHALESGDRLPLHQVLKLGNRIVIVGGPGSGKSTALQYLAWRLAHAFKTGETAGLAEALGVADPLPLPVYLPLSEYARYLRDLPANASGVQRRLDTFIADYMAGHHQTTDLGVTAGFIAALLAQERHLLVLLDGLDEVPTTAERELVSQAIEELVAGREHLRVVAASRVAAYHGNVALGMQFERVDVLPLDAPQLEQLVRAAYRCIYETSPSLAESQAQDMLRQIASVEVQRRERMGDQYEPLVNSPLMARIFLIIHFSESHLPEQRAELYRKAVEVLLRPDYKLDKSVMGDLERRIGESVNLSLAMHQSLAYAMHAQGEAQGREIGEAELRKALEGEPTFAPHVDDLVREATERGTLLEKRGDRFRFFHLSFQEYLTGRYLFQKWRDPDSIARFLEAGPARESWWREPILLMVGYANMEQVEIVPALLERMAGIRAGADGQDADLDTCLTMAELAAQAYLECIPKPADIEQPLQARLRRLIWQKEGEPRLRANAADALDQLGWAPDDLYEFVLIPADAPSAPGYPFYISRYPVTNRQYQRFLQAEDYAEERFWRGWQKFDERSQPMDETWSDEPWQWLKGRQKDPRICPDGVHIRPRYWESGRFGIVRPSAPVVGVAWYEASAYCRWLAAHWAELEEGRRNLFQPAELRLPTEQEWIAAAGGDHPQERYPWDRGNEATLQENEILQRANVEESRIGRTTPVWLYYDGVSTRGVWDLAGNVWEWCASFYRDHAWLALRGGSWGYDHNFARLSGRLGNHPGNAWRNFGFRMVALPS